MNRPVGEHLKYIVFATGRPIACFAFSSAPYSILIRDRFIGWSPRILENFVLDLIETIELVPRKFFKKLEATDDIWEVRVQHGNNIFRLFGFFYGNELVVLNHAFTKKTQKVPPEEIKIAEQRKKDYFSKRRFT